MILSRHFLNATSRDVQRCIGDSYALHVRVMALFRDTTETRAELGVLHRLDVSERDGVTALLIQSKTAPNTAHYPDHFLDPRAGADAVASTPLALIIDSLRAGALFRFRLRANPARKIDTKSAPDGTRRHGRRVPLRTDDDRVAWLVRHLAGFTIVAHEGTPALRQRSDGLSRGHRDGKRVTHAGVVFEGLVEVTEPAIAATTLTAGVGPAKAFGFGLLSLAPTARGAP